MSSVRRWRAICGFMLLQSISLYGFALTPAQALIEKMSYSARHLSYKGYFSYEKGTESASFYLVHWADSQKERQRLVFQDGPAHELISDGHNLKCLHSGDISEMAHLEMADPVPAIGAIKASLWEHYDVQLMASSRTANRPVMRVQLNPKDIYRYAYQFDIDEKTGLMLKMELLTLQGEKLEAFRYSTISYDDVTESDLLPQFQHAKVIAHGAEVDVHSRENDQWQLMWIPSGFDSDKQAMSARIRKASGQQMFHYGDGLSTFSVFIEPVGKQVSTDAYTQMGSTSAYMHYAQVGDQYYLITVVGEVPMQTVKKIALSVNFQP